MKFRVKMYGGLKCYFYKLGWLSTKERESSCQFVYFTRLYEYIHDQYHKTDLLANFNILTTGKGIVLDHYVTVSSNLVGRYLL